MKNFIRIFTASAALMFVSCETTQTIDVPDSSGEKIVIQAELLEGHIFSGITITHTLPVNTEYSIKDAEIKDAYAYLLIDGARVVPLHYLSNGVYNTLHQDLQIVAGEVYELFAEVRGKNYYAITKIPNTPAPHNVKYYDSGYLEAEVDPVQGQGFAAVWIMTLANDITADDFYSVEEVTSDDDSPVKVRTILIPDFYRAPAFRDKRRIQVYAFDKDYTDFFKTKANGTVSESGLITGGSSVKWNIAGENGIGLFIGLSKSKTLQAF